MNKQEQRLREAIRKELIRLVREQDLKEMTGTGAVAPFQSPYAFQGNSAQNKKKRKSTAEKSTFKVVQGRDDEETSSMNYK